MFTDISALSNYYKTNNKDNCCAADRRKCNSGKDTVGSNSRGGECNFN